MLKSDGSVLVHADGGSYKPLNWMSPPCSMRVEEPEQAEAELGIVENWRVEHAKMDDALIIHIHDIHEDISTDLEY